MKENEKNRYQYLSDNFLEYEEITDAYIELLINIDASATALPKKFYNELIKDITNNYLNLMKEISVNEAYNSLIKVKELKLERKELLLDYKKQKIEKKFNVNKAKKINNKNLKKELKKKLKAYKKSLKIPFFKRLFKRQKPLKEDAKVLVNKTE